MQFPYRQVLQLVQILLIAMNFIQYFVFHTCIKGIGHRFPQKFIFSFPFVLQSYTSPTTFIITKYPAPENAVDLLRLSIDQESQVIVCLDPLHHIESVRVFYKQKYDNFMQLIKLFFSIYLLTFCLKYRQENGYRNQNLTAINEYHLFQSVDLRSMAEKSNAVKSVSFRKKQV